MAAAKALYRDAPMVPPRPMGKIMQKSLCVLSYTDARRDPRVWRQIKALRQTYHITVVGLADPELEGVDFFPIKRKPKKSLGELVRAAGLLAGIHGPAGRRFYLAQPGQVNNVHFDLVFCNDAEPLPLAFALAKGVPVLFDAHEFYPLEFESSLKWRIFLQRYLTGLCREYIPRCAAMTTVSQGLAERYEKDFGVLPEVVFSAPELVEQNPSRTDPAHIRLVHHGAANRDRGLEQMIEIMRCLDGRFSLDLYLVGDQRYINTLKALAKGCPSIHWREPLPMQEIPTRLNGYDVGLCFLLPNTFNIARSVPNKLFEFLQARLAIAVGPSPDMAAIVREHNLGIVSDDFSPQAMAKCLNALTRDDIARYKVNTHNAAELFNASHEMDKIRAVVVRLTGEK